MLICCPFCNAEYDCEPGKYECECRAKFSVAADGSVTADPSVHQRKAPKVARIANPWQYETESAEFDIDRTIPPREHIEASSCIDATMPGKRDRKLNGRFEVGDLILGRYKVLSELGQGGMGVVYKCFDEIAGIIIALKALPPELSHNTLEMEDVKENFQLVHNLHHPNIASYNTLERDQKNGNYYLVMECVEGEDLRRWIKRKRKEGVLTLDAVLPLIRQVATALDYAHEQKIIHRDIKPGNIMINAEGHVKVLDFGLAAQIHTSMTRVSMAYHGTSGTAPYMAPEQWRGKAQGAAADQYALAVMTYEMLAGHLPFESADAKVLRSAVLNETSEPLSDIPSYAQNAMERGLAKESEDRFASCTEFVKALEGTAVAGAKHVIRKRNTVQKKAILFCSISLILVSVVVWSILAFAMNRRNSLDEFATDQSHSQDTSSKKLRNEAEVESVNQLEDNANHVAKHVEKNARSSGERHTFILPCNVNLEMVKVEAGSFEMGTKDGENDEDEIPHQVTLTKDFFIGRTEITQAQWKAVMENNPSNFKGDDLPVEWISWNDAMVFCEKLNSMGIAPSGWKFTLPTETQWEFAARGGNKSKGYKYSGSDKIDEVAWFKDNSSSKTHPVGQKKENELGLYDMSGNVSEWCLDNWQEDSRKLKAEFARSNEHGDPSRGDRGGSWGNIEKSCRSVARFFSSGRNIFGGFRIALVQPAEQEIEGKTDEDQSNLIQTTKSTNASYVKAGTTNLEQIQFWDGTVSLPSGANLEMVKVNAGTFEMVTKSRLVWGGYNESPHKAMLMRDFWIGQTEVTQAQWTAVMGNNPSHFKGDDLPVEMVSWNDAMEFCEELNKAGKAPSGWKFTLPTETQWEYAARGGKGSKHFTYSGSSRIDEVAWYVGNSGDITHRYGMTHPVGRKKANELGLYDMSGNVMEWCLDDWIRDSSKQKEEFTRGNDIGGEDRVTRGGGHNSSDDSCRSAAREPLCSYPPSCQRDFIGFRIALVQIQ